MKHNFGLTKKEVIEFFISVFVIIIIVVIAVKHFDRIKSFIKGETTVNQCLALSKKVRINENTKKCFNKLSPDEFLSLWNNEEGMKLYEEVNDYYDTRTDAQKEEDEKKAKEYLDEVLKDINNENNK